MLSELPDGKYCSVIDELWVSHWQEISEDLHLWTRPHTKLLTCCCSYIHTRSFNQHETENVSYSYCIYVIAPFLYYSFYRTEMVCIIWMFKVYIYFLNFLAQYHINLLLEVIDIKPFTIFLCFCGLLNTHPVCMMILCIFAKWYSILYDINSRNVCFIENWWFLSFLQWYILTRI
jgi:hypothetical protein